MSARCLPPTSWGATDPCRHLRPVRGHFAAGYLCRWHASAYELPRQRLLRINQCPAFEIAILQTTPAMGDVDEIGAQPVVPAQTNAIFAMTDKQIRSLPRSKEATFA